MLRAEKGYIIVGQETDGTVTPDDVGLGGLVAKSKAGLRRRAVRSRGRICVAPGRKQLVGLMTEDVERCWRRARRSSPTRRSRCRCACSVTSPRATGAPIAAARSRWRSSPAGRSLIGPKALRDDARRGSPKCGYASRFSSIAKGERVHALRRSRAFSSHAAGRGPVRSWIRMTAGQRRRDPSARASRALLVAHRPVAPCAGRGESPASRWTCRSIATRPRPGGRQCAWARDEWLLSAAGERGGPDRRGCRGGARVAASRARGRRPRPCRAVACRARGPPT